MAQSVNKFGKITAPAAPPGFEPGSWCVCEQENTLGCIKDWVELFETMWGVYPFYEQYILQSSWNLLKF